MLIATEARLVLGMLTALVVFPIVPGRVPWLMLDIALIALTHQAARRRALAALHLGVLSSSLLSALAALGSMDTWPLPPILALLVYTGVVRWLPALHGSRRWFVRGQLTRYIGVLIAASILMAGMGLLGWFAIMQPDYAELTGPLPHLPAPVLFLGMVGFCLVNAAAEELLYRGVLLGALDAALATSTPPAGRASAGAVPVLLQAIAFGTMHAHGVPRGLTGVGLTTIYGLMMGALRRRAQGMLAPWLAHSAADVIIGMILLRALT